MSDSFLDHIPGHERQKLLKRLRSPEEYERLRERVKGPEDLEKELEKMDHLAELHFALESDPKTQESMKKSVEKAMEQGIENVLEDASVSPEVEKSLEAGKFKLTVSAHPKTHQDQLMIVPEGNVQEKLPVTQQVSEQVMTVFLQNHKK